MAKAVTMSKGEVTSKEVVLQVNGNYFHINIKTLEYLTYIELECIAGKIELVTQVDKDLKKHIEFIMPVTLPEASSKPQKVHYMGRR